MHCWAGSKVSKRKSYGTRLRLFWIHATLSAPHWVAFRSYRSKMKHCLCRQSGHFKFLLLLWSYISKIDVCIIDEATECIEPLTLLTTQFGMPSLVLVGDSQLIPHAPYSSVSWLTMFGTLGWNHVNIIALRHWSIQRNFLIFLCSVVCQATLRKNERIDRNQPTT